VLAPVRSLLGHRSPLELLAVVSQFHVETAERYAPRRTSLGLETRCNIFLWDVTRAMDAEVPHWVTEEDLPCAVGKGKELTANGTVAWLSSVPARHRGWEEVQEPTARVLACEGKPVVAGWMNGHSPGHVAIVIPGSEPIGPTLIAQAGAECFSSGPLVRGFGHRPVQFWAHL
jgi:hypothetical protein